jgi:hypothetical protein
MGASVQELLGVDAQQSSNLTSSCRAEKVEQQYGGVHGARLLMQAGYSVESLLSATTAANAVHSPWDLCKVIIWKPY